MNTETITWHAVEDEVPDADTTVLIFHEQWPDEPTAQGYFDGEYWRDLENMKLDGAGGFLAPSHWADLPTGPCKAAS